MYSQANNENPPRKNRISFYVFNPQGNLGTSSFFEDEDPDEQVLNQWIHVVGVTDGQNTYIYKDGQLKDCDKYRAAAPGLCDAPTAGGLTTGMVQHPCESARDFNSFFEGSIQDVRVWNRALNEDEIRKLHDEGIVPRTGLVAEYALRADVAPSTAGGGNAVVYAPWVP